MKLATYLTHTHASLWGCTFKEAGLVLLGLQAINIVANIVTKIILGTTLYTLLPGFVIALVGTGTLLRVMGSIKKGKQEGYLALKARLILSHYFNYATPYVMRNGVWSTRRTKRG